MKALIPKYSSKFAATITILIGCMVLLGWGLDSTILKSIVYSFAPMKANTALTFIVAGVALWLVRDEQMTPTRRRAARFCALFVLLVSTLTLSQYLFGWNLGIDQLLFKVADSSLFPGRMSEATAFSFFLAGLTLWWLSSSQRHELIQALTLIVFSVGLLILAGYLFEVRDLYKTLPFHWVALLTGLTFMVWSMGVLLARPDHGFMAVLTADTLGGLMARRLLPAALVLPLLIGWLRQQGEQAGLYSTEFGVALFAVAIIFIFTAIIGWNARTLNRVDRERAHAEARSRKLYRTLSVLSDINQAIVRIRELPTLFNTICQIAVEKGDFRLAWIALIDRTMEKLNLAAHAGKDEGYVAALEAVFAAQSDSQHPFAAVLREGKRMVSNQMAHDPARAAWRAEARQQGIGAGVTLPLLVGGKVRGLLSLYTAETDFFDAEELRLLDEMAMDVSFAIEFAEQEAQRQRAEAAVNRYIKRLEILHEIDTGLLQGGSALELIKVALMHIQRVIPCQRAGILLFDYDKNEVVFFVVDAKDPDAVQKTNIRLPIPPSDWFDDFSPDHTRIIDDLFLLPNPPTLYQYALKDEMRSILHVLLVDQGNPIGSFNLLHKTPHFFTAEQAEVGIEIANQLTIAIRQLRLNEALERYTAELEQKVRERTADLRASTEQIEAILNNSIDGIVLVDAELRIQRANAAFVRLFGLTSGEDFAGASLLDLIHPFTSGPIRETTELASASQMGRRVEARALRKDGTNFDVEIGIQQIENDGMVCTIRDVTERKAYERQLRYFGSVQESVSDAVFTTDMSFRIQSWNRAAERIYGWRADEVLGLETSNVLRSQYTSEDEREMHQQEFLANGYWDREIVQYRKDGTQIHIQSIASVLRDSGGSSIGVVAVNRDITQQKAQERQLRYFGSVQESVSDAVITLDIQFRIQSWNKTAERIYGWRADEVLGLDVGDAVKTLFVDKDERETIRQDIIINAYLEREVFQRRKDGTEIYIHSSVTALRDDNQTVIGIVVVNRDITQQKAQEQQLRYFASVQESVSDAVITTDAQYRIQSWNKGAEHIYGWRADEAIGQDVGDLLKTRFVSEEERARLRQEILTNGSWESEVIQQRKDGTEIQVQSAASVLRDSAGRSVGIVTVVRDITERKHAEALLMQALEKEKELNELKTRFVWMTSHEFRTPLATILAATETIVAYRRKMTDEQIDQRLTKIKDQVAYLKGIMEEVLEVARMQIRRVDFHVAPFDLHALCGSIIDEFLSRPDVMHQIDFLSDQAACRVTLDERIIRQVINNLVSNAVKYSPDGKAVTVSLEAAEDSVILKVRDEGIGIPPDDLKHLFEPFHRAKNVGSIQGTGLGLTITKESVELHGGTISVDSEVGVGTTFTVNLPYEPILPPNLHP